MFILIITRKYKLLSILIQEKLIATVPKQWGCCSYFSYGFLLWTTSLIFLCQNSRLMNYFYRTTLPIGKKNKRQQGKEMPWMITSTALLKTWAALCQQSPKSHTNEFSISVSHEIEEAIAFANEKWSSDLFLEGWWELIPEMHFAAG